MAETIQVEQPQRGGGCGKVAIGCGIAAVIALIIAGVVTWYVISNAKSWATDVAVMGAKSAVTELKLPDDQKQRVNAKIDQLANEFKAGNVTLEQIGRVFENILQGPIFSAGMAMMVERQYLEGSGLSEEEKSQASVTLRRVAQGLVNKKLTEADFEYITDPIATTDAEGNRTIKNTATDEELRQMLERAKEKADAANVEEQPERVNFADEFEKAVDDALAQP